MAGQAPGRASLIGLELGHYRIAAKIGVGGMGEVYRARDEHLDREVAIKVLPPGALANESCRHRFHKEALTLSRLNHPNIATIYDFDTQQGVDFLVMEYIVGITLSEKLPRPLPEKEVIALGTQLCEGLSAAHDQGVVHRDLKPGNLRLSGDGRLKILDFGLAKLRLPHTASAATESFSETQAFAGTLPYMAPEQLLNEELDNRADIWAMGCVLYEMATGRPPFSGTGPALVDEILHRSPAPPSKLNPKLSAGLEAIILKCLEKDPSLRYTSAHDTAVDLRRLTSSPSMTGPGVPTRRARSRLVSIISFAVAVVALLALTAIWLSRRAIRVAPPAQATPSIAVLPFVDMSPGKDQEYFSDGLAEELLNALSNMPELRVTARTSSFQFKGKNEDLRIIGEKLNVATVLEGSVRKQGDRVRITAQLIKVSDGFHLWSETYDRDLKDVFAVQEEIARAVAGSLKMTLLGAKARSPQATTPEAYNAYLQGKYFDQRGTKENQEKAIAYYQRALDLDPRYAPAWAALSGVRSMWAMQNLPAQELQIEVSKARKEAERALALNPNLAYAYAALGLVKRDYDWDWEGANTAFRRALALSPGDTRIVNRVAVTAAVLNHFDEALGLARRAVELDPLSVEAYLALGFDSWWAGRQEEAAAALQKGIELDPEYPFLHTHLGRVYLAESRPEAALAETERETHPAMRLQGLALVYHALGRKQQADEALTELIAKHNTMSAFQIAEVYAFRGHADKAMEWLDRAYALRDGGLTTMRGDPLLKNLERDPRYIAFLKKMRLYS